MAPGWFLNIIGGHSGPKVTKNGVLKYPGDILTFTADVMLKKLAKYLRALGYDTLFSENYSDQALQNISIKEKRILLTRDQDLFHDTPEINSFYVKPQNPHSQLGLIAKYYPLEYDDSRFMTRCLECNTELVEQSGEQLKDRIPPKVYQRHDTFYYCIYCEQVFWQGDHVDRLRNRLLEILAKSGTAL